MAVLQIVTFLLGVFAMGQAAPTPDFWCNMYNQTNPDHTMCKPLVGPAVSDADKDIILTKHNEARSAAVAANMLIMTWDDTLAELAQRWVNTCPGGHEAQGYDRHMFGRYTVGQNWAGSSEIDVWGQMVDLWLNERDDYTFTINECAPGKVCGHYTQAVWAATHKIGCAATTTACPNGFYEYVCNYAPAGNVNQGSPYVAVGDSSALPCQTQVSGQNLCDCGGMTCRNNGVLDVSTCECTCDSFGKFLGTLVEPNCATSCASDSEYSGCGGPHWEESDCKNNANQWAIYCPKTCKVCPAIENLSMDD